MFNYSESEYTELYDARDEEDFYEEYDGDDYPEDEAYEDDYEGNDYLLERQELEDFEDIPFHQEYPDADIDSYGEEW